MLNGWGRTSTPLPANAFRPLLPPGAAQLQAVLAARSHGSEISGNAVSTVASSSGNKRSTSKTPTSGTGRGWLVQIAAVAVGSSLTLIFRRRIAKLFRAAWGFLESNGWTSNPHKLECERGRYSAVNSERMSLLQVEEPDDEPEVVAPSKGDARPSSKRSEAGISAPSVTVSAPLRALGEAVQATLARSGGLGFSGLAGRLLSSGVSRRQDDDSDCSDVEEAPRHASEKQGLLRKGSGNDQEDEDPGSQQDQDSISAIMKLRPAARDSVGDDAEENGGDAARPLIGTDRASILSR